LLEAAMHVLNASWLIIILVACIVGVVAFLWPRRRPNTDLGTVSDSWIAEHVTNTQRS
jgi:hypothetical protein